MSKSKQYQLLVASSAVGMTTEVNQMIDMGWMPYEGLAVNGSIMQWMQYAPSLIGPYSMKLLFASNGYGLAEQVDRMLIKGWDLYLGTVTGNGYLYQWMVSVQDGVPAQVTENSVVADLVITPTHEQAIQRKRAELDSLYRQIRARRVMVATCLISS